MFAGIITFPETTKILECGFVWSDKDSPTLEDFRKNLPLEAVASSKQFLYQLESGLRKNHKYYVRTFFKTADYILYGNTESFISNECSAPEISSFSPQTVLPGTKITVRGNHFALNKTKNIVSVNGIALTVDSVSETGLYLKIPFNIRRKEKAPINLISAGQAVTSKASLKILYPWNGKKKLKFEVSFGACASLSNKGYWVNTYNKKMYVYHPDKDQWSTDTSLPEDSGDKPVLLATKTKLYALLYNDFWSYTPGSGKWERESNFPGNRGSNRKNRFCFSVNGRIFIGYCSKMIRLWEYSADSKKWTEKAPLTPYTSNELFDSFCFSTSSHGYLGLNYREDKKPFSFWEYNPSEDSWVKRPSIPFPTADDYCSNSHSEYYNLSSFSIKNKGFVGLGRRRYYGGYRQEMWEYDPKSTQWKRHADAPESFSAPYCFSIGNKAYLMANEANYYNYKNRVWEFSIE
ncbi:MAG: IPT/TIG domain-containing protein [Cytophagales bacterium]|nr:IPT/TIG domain-containing protein [Cytophagales bacterium]